MEADYGAAFQGYPTFPLINAETMEVIDPDCYFATPQYQGLPTMQACLDAHLD